MQDYALKAAVVAQSRARGDFDYSVGHDFAAFEHRIAVGEVESQSKHQMSPTNHGGNLGFLEMAPSSITYLGVRVAGFSSATRPLEDATRIAYCELIRWMVAECDTTSGMRTRC